MPHSLKLFVLIVCAWLLPADALSHGGEDETAYVMENGTDAGDCALESPCGSIGYALARLGKGGKIKIGAGRFVVAGRDELFHLLNGSISISGGYDAAASFRASSIDPTVISGVPGEFAADLVERGFTVIADSKAVDRALVAEVTQNIEQHRALQSSMTASPCVCGSVNGMACLDIDLLSHVAKADVSARPGDAADVWGFVDLNSNREYAFVGFDIGTANDFYGSETPRDFDFDTGADAEAAAEAVNAVLNDWSDRFAPITVVGGPPLSSVLYDRFSPPAQNRPQASYRNKAL